MTNQGKLIKNTTQGKLEFFKAYLGWSIETFVSKSSNIAILSAKISSV